MKRTVCFLCGGSGIPEEIPEDEEKDVPRFSWLEQARYKINEDVFVLEEVESE